MSPRYNNLTCNKVDNCKILCFSVKYIVLYDALSNWSLCNIHLLITASRNNLLLILLQIFEN